MTQSKHEIDDLVAKIGERVRACAGLGPDAAMMALSVVLSDELSKLHAVMAQRSRNQCRAHGCKNAGHARGLCPAHYAQDLAGRPLTPIRKKPDVCVVGCQRPATAGGYCVGHAAQTESGLEITPILGDRATMCAFEGCGRYAVGGVLCSAHRTQKYRGQRLTPISTTRRAFKYRRGDDEFSPYIEVIRWDDGGVVLSVRVSSEDVDALVSVLSKKHSFSVKSELHREVARLQYGDSVITNAVIDHINGDTSDNRRTNIRITNMHGNMQNVPVCKRETPEGYHIRRTNGVFLLYRLSSGNTGVPVRILQGEYSTAQNVLLAITGEQPQFRYTPSYRLVGSNHNEPVVVTASPVLYTPVPPPRTPRNRFYVPMFTWRMTIEMAHQQQRRAATSALRRSGFFTRNPQPT